MGGSCKMVVSSLTSRTIGAACHASTQALGAVSIAAAVASSAVDLMQNALCSAVGQRMGSLQARAAHMQMSAVWFKANTFRRVRGTCAMMCTAAHTALNGWHGSEKDVLLFQWQLYLTTSRVAPNYTCG